MSFSRRDFIKSATATGLTILAAPSDAMASSGNATSKQTVSEIIDGMSRRVSLPDNIQRVSPAQPLAQLVIAALDPSLLATCVCPPLIGQRVSKDEDEPIATGKLKDATALSGIAQQQLANAETELIVSIEAPSTASVESVDLLQTASDIPVVSFDATSNSFADVFRTLGALLDKEERAEELASYMEKESAVLSSFSDLTSGPSVFYAIGDEGLATRGVSSFHGSLLSLVGATPIAPAEESGTTYEVTKEWVLESNPDFVVFESSNTHSGLWHGFAQNHFIWWRRVPAIQNRKFACSPDGWLAYPPLQAHAIGARWLRYALCEDIDEGDLIERAQEYYELFQKKTYPKRVLEKGIEKSMASKHKPEW